MFEAKNIAAMGYSNNLNDGGGCPDRGGCPDTGCRGRDMGNGCPYSG